MTAIRSMADELREKMRQVKSAAENTTPPESSPADGKENRTPAKKKAGKPPPAEQAGLLETLFNELTAYELNGNEKLLIRLDNRTVFLLKQLKVAKGIDMNKLIAYSLDTFLKERPELINYIKATLQNIEL